MSKITIEKRKLETLKRKASFLDEVLELAEEKNLGHLMEQTEKEENVTFLKAQKYLK